MTEIWLVRHGQASFGKANYDALSELGIRQTQLLGQHLSALAQPINAYVSGSLQRQRHSAEHAQCQPATVDAAFNEYAFEAILKAYFAQVAQARPDLELGKGNLYQDPKRFQHFFEASLALWLSGSAPDVGHSQLESWATFRQRVIAGLQQAAAAQHARVAIFTSGGVIAVACQAALGLSDETTFALNWRVNNASITRIKVGKRGISLLGFNDTTYLQLAQDPTLITYR